MFTSASASHHAVHTLLTLLGGGIIFGAVLYSQGVNQRRIGKG